VKIGVWDRVEYGVWGDSALIGVDILGIVEYSESPK